MTTLEEKMSLVHDYYLSDQSRKDYCHSHNINETTLRYYITKHHQIGGSTSSCHPNAPKRQKIVPSVSPEDYSRLKVEYQSLQEKYDQLFEKFNHTEKKLKDLLLWKEKETSNRTISRRKPDSKVTTKYKRLILSSFAKELSIIFRDYPPLERLQVLQDTIKMISDSFPDASRFSEKSILDSLIKTFAESLKYCIKLKNSSNFILLTSLLCSSFTLKRINHLLAPHNCCISQYSWHQSQLHKDCQGSGILEKKEFKRSNAMTSLSSIQEAVRFIKSSEFFKAIAHGTHFARLSDGSRVRLSNRIRKKSKKHIWQAYKEYQSPEKK